VHFCVKVYNSAKLAACLIRIGRGSVGLRRNVLPQHAVFLYLRIEERGPGCREMPTCGGSPCSFRKREKRQRKSLSLAEWPVALRVRPDCEGQMN